MHIDFFFKDIHEGYYLLKDADDEQLNVSAKIKNLGKDKKTSEKEFSLNQLGLLFIARKNVPDNFKSKLFPIKNLDEIPTRKSTPEPETKPTKHKKSKLKLQQKFMNEIIANEKDINYEYFSVILSIRIHDF